MKGRLKGVKRKCGGGRAEGGRERKSKLGRCVTEVKHILRMGRCRVLGMTFREREGGDGKD